MVKPVTDPVIVALVVRRNQLGLSQVVVADACGINRMSLSDIERGSSSPTLKTLRKLTEYFGAELNVLIAPNPASACQRPDWNESSN